MKYEVVVTEKTWGKSSYGPPLAINHTYAKVIEADLYEVGHCGSLTFIKDRKLVVIYPAGYWYRLAPLVEEEQHEQQ